MLSLVVSKVTYFRSFEVIEVNLKFSADKRKHTQQITALKNQIKGEQDYSDEQEALLGPVYELFSKKWRTLLTFCSLSNS